MLTKKRNSEAGSIASLTAKDREAALAFLHKVVSMNWVTLKRTIRAIQEGRADEHGLSHIFAEHRHRADKAARIDGVRLGLDAAMEIARMLPREQAIGASYRTPQPDIEALLETISAEELAAFGPPRRHHNVLERFA